MKKKIWYSMILCMTIMMVSCVSCDFFKKSESKQADTPMNVEALVKADKDQMAKVYTNDYRWFETQMVLKDFLDDSTCDGTVTEVTNVFQFLVNADSTGGFDTQVVMFKHTSGNTDIIDVHGFWVGDNPLNDENIVLTFKDAYDKVMATNSPKPHSRQVVLRKEVGPVPCNPQYVFGNPKAQLYVDAVNGEVSDKNPAYKGTNITMPLGEWP